MRLKKKSLFSQIILLIILALICIVLTIGIALFVGSIDVTLLDFKNLNLANVIPVLLIGGFISCVIIGIVVLFIARSIFLKIRDYFAETNDDGGNEK